MLLNISLKLPTQYGQHIYLIMERGLSVEEETSQCLPPPMSVLLIWNPCKIIWTWQYMFQVSSSVDQQFPRGILKSPIAEAVINSKQVQFFGLSSDSDSSLVSIPKQW